MKISKKLNRKLRKLTDEALSELRTLLIEKNQLGELAEFEVMGIEWKDMSNNDIVKIDNKNIYFDNGTGIESYPIEEMDIQDILYVIGLFD